MPERDPILMCWSGGKDSAMALYDLLLTRRHRVDALLTTVTEGYERISMHGVRRELLAAQAASLGLPLDEVRIPPQCINPVYEARMEAALRRHMANGIRRVAFGDIFLEDLRAYRERNLARVEMEAVFSIWKRDTRELFRQFLAAGFRAVVVCVDSKTLDASFAGRHLDENFLNDLPPGADPCGENGEFHTFVFDGPIFREPIRFAAGPAIERDGFVYTDLIPLHIRRRVMRNRIAKEWWSNPRTWLLLSLIVFAAVVRVLPHPWNFTPVGAMALFGGATFSSRRAALFYPLLTLFVGDLFVGFHTLMPVVYASFLLSVAIGFWLRGRRSVPRIGAATLAGAVQFFLVTNFGVWLSGMTYPKTSGGLVACYVAGIPYFWNTLAGDALYAALLFGGLAQAERYFPSVRQKTVMA